MNIIVKNLIPGNVKKIFMIKTTNLYFKNLH
jgi:hypothetical protein